MFIDSHCHLSSVNDKDNYLKKITEDSDLEAIIDIGMDYASSFDAVKNSYKNNKVYATVGIHPDRVRLDEKCERLYSLANSDKVVAIGEIGLENTDDVSKSMLQQKYLIKQIIIANALELPVIIHANNNLYEIKNVFERIVKPKYGCVFHCFQPDIEFLKYVVDNGYYVSFAGKILKPNAKKSIEVIRNVPKELYMVETDAPYIEIPGKDESNSIYIPSILEKISEIRCESIEEVSNQSVENTKRLFYKMK